jgi:hypothetical protein
MENGISCRGKVVLPMLPVSGTIRLLHLHAYTLVVRTGTTVPFFTLIEGGPRFVGRFLLNLSK